MQGENKVLWSGTNALCQTITLATGMGGGVGERETGRGQRRGGQAVMKTR